MEDLKTYIVSSVKMFYYLISNVIQLVFQLFYCLWWRRVWLSGQQIYKIGYKFNTENIKK